MFFGRRQFAVFLQILHSLPIFPDHGVRETEIKVAIGEVRFEFNRNSIVYLRQRMITNFGVKIREIVVSFVVARVLFQAKVKQSMALG